MSAPAKLGTTDNTVQDVRTILRELTTEFGNGFSYANLKNMGKFYKTYRIRKVTHCVSNYLEATNG